MKILETLLKQKVNIQNLWIFLLCISLLSGALQITLPIAVNIALLAVTALLAIETGIELLGLIPITI